MKRAEAIVATIRRTIELGVLLPGARLPSIRNAAVEYGVAKNTVVEAYDRLVAAGLARSRPGSGFVVQEAQPKSSVKVPEHVAEAVDIASLLSAQLEESFSIRAGDGRPPPSWTEESEIRRHLGLVGRARRSNSDGYGSAWGLPSLRLQLALGLLRREIRVEPDQVLLTFGANHALDLVIRRFLIAGDTVLVDDPGYYPLFAKLKLAQVQIVGVKRLPDGPDLEALERQALATRPKLFFTQSIAQNPTGGSTSLAAAHGVLKAAGRHGFMVVEDEPFIDLPTAKGIGLAPLDQLRNVILIGTFAKTLSASLRCGYVAGSADTVASLAELKMLTTVNSSGHVERLVHRLITDGHYLRHLKRLGHRVEAATAKVTRRLTEDGHELLTPPAGGYYLYLRLPRGIDDIALAKEGAREGIFIAPGSVFSIEKRNQTVGMRINITQVDDERFYDFLKRKLR